MFLLPPFLRSILNSAILSFILCFSTMLIPAFLFLFTRSSCTYMFLVVIRSHSSFVRKLSFGFSLNCLTLFFYSNFSSCSFIVVMIVVSIFCAFVHLLLIPIIAMSLALDLMSLLIILILWSSSRLNIIPCSAACLIVSIPSLARSPCYILSMFPPLILMNAHYES